MGTTHSSPSGPPRARATSVVQLGALDPARVEACLDAAFAEVQPAKKRARRPGGHVSCSLLLGRHEARQRLLDGQEQEPGDPALWRPLPDSDGTETQLLDLIDMAAAADAADALAARFRAAWRTDEERELWSGLLWEAAAAAGTPAVAASLAAYGPWSVLAVARVPGTLGGAATFVGPEVWEDVLAEDARESGETRWLPDAWTCAHHLLLRRGVTLEEYANSGTYGTVVLATDRAPPGVGRGVAVKVMIQEDDGERDEMDEEMRTYARIAASEDAAVRAGARRHLAECNRVLRVTGAYRVVMRGAWVLGVLVMERADYALDGYLRHAATRHLDAGERCAERLGLAADLCLGLGALHRAGLVVCDLKPPNVLVVREPGRTTHRAVLADFGMNVDAAESSGKPVYCAATPGWGTVRANAPSEFGRPAQPEHDWYIFAKMVLQLFAYDSGVPCGVSVAPDDWVERLEAALDAEGQGRASVPLGKYTAPGPDGRRCVETNKAAELACVANDPQARRLVLWAARWVRATNQLVEQAGLPTPQEDPVARWRRLAMLRPAERTEPGFVPPGLERAVEDRVAATAGPE